MSYRSAGSLLTWLICLLLASPAPAFEPSAVQVEPLAKSATSWNGTALPAYPAGQPEVTVLRIRVAPGARLPLHEHPVINAAVMLAGELRRSGSSITSTLKTSGRRTARSRKRTR